MIIFSDVLSKKYRLKKKNDFARVMRGGGTAVGDCLILRFQANQREESRVGFVCSKKVAIRAVARNKIKRRLREIIRATWPDVKTGYDLVFLARPCVAGLGFEEMRAVVEKLLKKARLMISR